LIQEIFEFQKIFLTSVDDVLRESNYDSAIFPLLSRDRLARFSDENNFLYHTDAVIISSLAPERLFKEGKIPTKKPYIIVDSHGDYKNSVTINNFLGGYLAGKNLKIHKNKKIYLIGGYETDDIFSSGVFGERTKGFIKALEDRGINYSDIEIENIVLDWNQAFDFGKKVSQFQKNFSVFSVSDLVAWGFTEGCRVNNLISGRDYHIIGYDNCSFAEKIGLTTINQPISDLGTISAQKILEKINGSDRDENVVLNPDYVERNSN